MSMSQFLRAITARWLLVAGCGAGLALAALAVSLVLPKRYTAEVQMVIEARVADPVLGEALPQGANSGYLNTQVDIIGSERVAERVAGRLQLADDPALRAQWIKDTGGAGNFAAWQAAALKKWLKVAPSRDSNLVTLAYTGTDPDRAAAIANAFAEAYVDTNLELRVEPARESAGWFDERTRSLREQLTLAQQRLSAYQQGHGIVATDEKLDVELARLADLSAQLVQVQGLRAETRSRHGQAGAGELLPEVLQNAHVQGLKAELARRGAERDQLAGRVGANHPERARVEAEIAALRDRLERETARIASSLGTANLISTAREREIQAALDVQKQRVLKFRAERDAVAVLQREVESAQRAFDLVNQRYSETSLESQARQTNVAILNRAAPPARPASPRPVLNTVLGLLFGCVLGAGLALGLELARPRLRGAADWTEGFGVPVLGELPKVPISPVRGGRTRPV